MLTDGLAYEVTVELSERHRDRFEAWLPNVVLDWTTQPDVRSFRVYRGADVEGVRLRFVFTFASESDWERFVQRGAHRERMATLESVSAAVRTALWEPGAIALHDESPVIVDAHSSRAAAHTSSGLTAEDAWTVDADWLQGWEGPAESSPDAGTPGPEP